jgi:phospholipid/cholesterol/gamma-HCH transport system substrate-binding protein
MDLIVGGSILAALVILIAGVLWLKEATVTRKMVRYTVLFPNIGTLQNGDPVMVNGMHKGSVRKIELKEPYVSVIISIERDVRLTDSCDVRIQNIGLMGERCVGIQLSSQGTVYKPDGRKKDEVTYIMGNFDSGIAEAMGMLGVVLGEVEQLVENVKGIVGATVGDTAFVATFRAIMERLDNSVRILETIVVTNKPDIEQSIRSIRTITADIDRLLEQHGPRIDAIMENGAALTGNAERITVQAESLMVALQQIVDKIERGEGSVGMLLSDEQFKEELRQTVSDLDTLVTEAQHNGLPVKIRLFGGSKKKKRN